MKNCEEYLDLINTDSRVTGYRLQSVEPALRSQSLVVSVDEGYKPARKAIDEEPDFTMRSVVVGTCIGVIMAAQNIYFGLRNGLSFGEGMVAAVLGYSLAKTILRRFFQGFNLHEHVILTTAASANISIIFSGGFTQYILAMTPQLQAANQLGKKEDTWNPTYSKSFLWLLVAAYLGFFISQPYRRKLIVEQRLPWPHPTATAKILRTLHLDNDDSRLLTRRLAISIVCAFCWHWFRWLFNSGGGMDQWPIFGAAAAQYTWYTDWSPAYIAGGMLTTPNAVLSMLFGGIYGYGFILPYVSSKRGVWYAEDGHGMAGAKAYWFLSSLGMVVMDGVYNAIKLVILSFRDQTKGKSQKALELANIERQDEPSSRLVPTKFWLPAFIINMLLVIIVIPFLFPVKWYLVLVVILLAIPLGYSVCLGGAITGTFIISAVGKLVIVVIGPLAGSVLGSLWLSGIGMITVGSTEQVLVDYQVAHLTKTSPRKMFKAQLIAATVGFIVTPLCYTLFIQAFEITADGRYTAPGGVALRSLAVLFVEGFGVLPSNIAYFIIPSMIFALINCLLNDLLPSRYAKFLPNTMAFAIGFYVNGCYPLNTFIGGVVRYIWKRKNPDTEKSLCSIVAAGMIVGEGLAAINQAILTICGVTAPAAIALRFGSS